MTRLIKNKWAEIKNTPLGIVFKILLTCAVIFVGYKLSVSLFVWSFCGVRELSGIEIDIFFTFCPQEAHQRYEEHLFWEECVKQDKQIPPNTEIVISACTDPEVRGEPNGEILFVHEKKTGDVYLLDLRTGEKKQVSYDTTLLNSGIFLNSELVWLKPPLEPSYFLSLTNGQIYEFVDLRAKFPDGFVKNNKLIPEVALYFIEAEQFFVHYGYGILIILSPDFRQHPENSYIFRLPLFGTWETRTEYAEFIERLMGDLKINYKVIDLSLEYAEVPSPTGKYTVSTNGIFLSGSDAPIVPGEYTSQYKSFISWYYDESGIVFTQGSYYYFQDFLSNSYFRLPRPILKLKLPEP